jgi:Domain of unknown function (DUF4450)
MRSAFTKHLLVLAATLCSAIGAASQGNFTGKTDRPLRYHPDKTDFVIENGKEFFNRPLYGGNTAFRSDVGDKPEFTLYLPGRGGNLRFGIRTPGGEKWLHDARKIISRYRPGSMLYEITDPLMGKGKLLLTALAMNKAEGLVVQAELQGIATPVELICAYGGVNGDRGRRSGDIGTEAIPISEFFRLKPEYCAGNKFSITSEGFTLESKVASITGILSGETDLSIYDAGKWNNLRDLLASESKDAAQPVIAGRIRIDAGKTIYIGLQKREPGKPAYRRSELSRIFEEAEKHRRSIAEKVVVETPDEYINAAAAALNVAADAVWDEPQGAFMHGAVAWRNKLLGWRGPYAGDALGWHDRMRRHLAYWASRQNTSPVKTRPVIQDVSVNFARNEPELHSNGDISNSHYDMNMVYIDALFRHLLWTGDLQFAREMFPVIKRHLAWERRLFRREVGEDKLPLYEAYVCIWASDDLQYNGGGVTHASAYNYYHNKMAARLARLIGEEPAEYEREADLVLKAMKKYLWLANRGHYAEYKDLLGDQLVHPSAALWTFYHTIDSEAMTPTEAYLMSRYVDTQIAHIPVKGAGVPVEGLYTLPTTNWMPYAWSTNNVVMAENMHTSLGFWQAGRGDEAFRLFKGSVLSSMFLGLCPGNAGMTNTFDMARGESQRDFADTAGTMSRALVEGLFGIKPDALAGELKIEPGFPSTWDGAKIRHPDIDFAFRREKLKDAYTVETRFSKEMRLRLVVPAYRTNVDSVTVNGKPAEWRELKAESVGAGRIEVTPATPSTRYEIKIDWSGGLPVFQASKLPVSPKPSTGGMKSLATNWNAKELRKTETIDLSAHFNDKLTDIFKHDYLSPRSPNVSLAIPKQGIGSWAHWDEKFEVNDTGLRKVAEANGGRFVLPNGIAFNLPIYGKNVVFTSRWDNFPREAEIPLSGTSSHIYLLMAGSTNQMQSRIDNGEIVVTYTDGTSERLALNNPVNWWPIDQDYFIDDFAFKRPEALPPRVDLQTGRVRILDPETFKGTGKKIPGGAGTVLDLPLNAGKQLRSLKIRAITNEVVIGLMAATLVRN